MTAQQETAASALEASPLLATALQMAVPLEIEKLRRLPAQALEGHRASLDGLTAVASDAMQFGGKGAGLAFAAHVRAFALLALLAEGGIDFCGLHWCAVPGCRARYRLDHAPGTGDGVGPKTLPLPEQRATHTVPVTGIYL